MSQLFRFSGFYINQFLSTTAVRGFSFIKASTTLPEKFLWIAVVIAFTGLTFRDIHKSIQLYMEQPTSTRFSSLTNDSITLDSPLVCSSSDFTQLNISFDETNTTELKKFLAKFQSISNIDDFAADYINSSLDDDSKESMMYLLSMVITNIVRLEQFVLIPNKQLNLGFYPPSKHVELNGSTVNGAIIHNFFANRMKNYTKVMWLTCKFLCLKTKLKSTRMKVDFVTGDYDFFTESPCDNCFWLGFYNRTGFGYICTLFRLREAFTLTKPFDSMIISLSPYEILRKNTTSVIIGAYALLGFQNSFGHRSIDDLMIRYGQETAVAMQILGHYQTVSTWHKPCGSSSYFSCVAFCQTELLIKYCNCSPLFSSMLANTHRHLINCGSLDTKYSSVGTQIKLSACKDRISRIEVDNCDLNCPESCTTALTTYTHVPFRRKSNFINETTLLEIYVIQFSYPKVIEFLTMSLEDLIVRFAGNLSLWLGASFIALIHICVFLLKIPCEVEEFQDKEQMTLKTKQIPIIEKEIKIKLKPDHVYDVVKYQTHGFAPKIL